MNHWKQFERDCAALFGTERFKANTGGSLDFESDDAVGQCKLVKTLSLEQLSKFAEKAATDGFAKQKVGVLCVKVARGRGWKKKAEAKAPMIVAMTAETFDAWFSMRKPPDAAP